MLLSFLSALLGILTYPPFGMYGLVFVFLVPYFLFLMGEKRLWRMIGGTFVFRLTIAVVVGLEAYEPLLFIQSASLFLILPLSLWFLRRSSLSEYKQLIAIPVLFVAAEYAQAQFTLLPSIKAYSGVNLAASPFLGLARWGGVLLLSLFAVSVNVLIVAAWQRVRHGSSGWRKLFSFWGLRAAMAEKKGRALLAAAAAAIVFGLLISQLGLWERREAYEARGNALRIALVSVAEPFDKEIEDLSDTLSRGQLVEIDRLVQERLSRISAALPISQFDLIVFPEALFFNDYRGDEDGEAREKFGITNGGTLIRAYRALAQNKRSEVLAYFPTLTADGRRYSSGVLFARDGTISGVYNKKHLAYSGEYWPFGDWKPWYADTFARMYPNIAKRSPVFDKRYVYDREEQTSLLTLESGARIASPICSEGHYPSYLGELVGAGAQFIVHPSSNNWVDLGLKKYLESLVWFRQIEAVRLGVPMVLSGRQEYAGVIEPDGRRNLIYLEDAEGFVVYDAKIRL
jgi:apolipoprotein N-acyltransferase